MRKRRKKAKKEDKRLVVGKRRARFDDMHVSVEGVDGELLGGIVCEGDDEGNMQGQKVAGKGVTGGEFPRLVKLEPQGQSKCSHGHERGERYVLVVSDGGTDPDAREVLGETAGDGLKKGAANRVQQNGFGPVVVKMDVQADRGATDQTHTQRHTPAFEPDVGRELEGGDGGGGAASDGGGGGGGGDGGHRGRAGANVGASSSAGDGAEGGGAAALPKELSGSGEGVDEKTHCGGKREGPW